MVEGPLNPQFREAEYEFLMRQHCRDVYQPLKKFMTRHLQHVRYVRPPRGWNEAGDNFQGNEWLDLIAGFTSAGVLCGVYLTDVRIPRALDLRPPRPRRVPVRRECNRPHPPAYRGDVTGSKSSFKCAAVSRSNAGQAQHLTNGTAHAMPAAKFDKLEQWNPLSSTVDVCVEWGSCHQWPAQTKTVRFNAPHRALSSCSSPARGLEGHVETGARAAAEFRPRRGVLGLVRLRDLHAPGVHDTVPDHGGWQRGARVRRQEQPGVPESRQVAATALARDERVGPRPSAGQLQLRRHAGAGRRAPGRAAAAHRAADPRDVPADARHDAVPVPRALQPLRARGYAGPAPRVPQPLHALHLQERRHDRALDTPSNHAHPQPNLWASVSHLDALYQ
ncbi:hypothetical protein ON010_g11851 [Phytophthora cinnamomi]|nr:hypothetical protein ON010_g11851 [Phytophthora cinnamomi]